MNNLNNPSVAKYKNSKNFKKLSFENKQAILALSSDLTRITQSIQKGSYDVADKFSQSALNWLGQIKKTQVENYIKDILKTLETQTLKRKNSLIKADHALTYSTILQNYGLLN